MSEKQGDKTTIAELKNIMVKAQVPSVDYTVLQPGLIIGGINTAKNTEVLTKLGVTHIINCAYDPTGKGNFIYVDTNEDYYTVRDFKCVYLGVRAADTARFNISKFFYDVANFIDNAIKENGIVYIHCYMAISRSAVLVIAYYMIKHNMNLKEAVVFLRNTAKNTEVLTKLGVTHIINCAYDPTGKGNFIYVDTNEDYYTVRDFKCVYLGVRAADTARFNISKFFYDVANFIDNAIKENGIVYIHCYMAISRSAVLVIAYYMIKHNMNLKEAVVFLRKKREIFPNDGFLVQLMELDQELRNT